MKTLARYSWGASLPLCFLLTPPAQASSFVSQKDTAQDSRGQLGNELKWTLFEL